MRAAMFPMLHVVSLSCMTGCEKARSLAAGARGEKIAQTEQTLAAGGQTATGGSVVELADGDFPRFVQTAGRLVIVDFHASWCGTCLELDPVLERQVRATPGVILGKVDVDRAPRTTANQNVSGLPDVRFYRDGKEVHRFLGFPGEEEIKSLIARHSAGVSPGNATSGVPNPHPTPPPLTPASKDWLPPGMQRR